MRLTNMTLAAALLAASACSKPHVRSGEPAAPDPAMETPAMETEASPQVPRSEQAATPEAGVQGSERKAGTYDPRRDRAPGAGPGAPRVGDVPGTGLAPIDHPVPATPPTSPSAPPLDVTPTTPE